MYTFQLPTPIQMSLEGNLALVCIVSIIQLNKYINVSYLPVAILTFNKYYYLTIKKFDSWFSLVIASEQVVCILAMHKHTSLREVMKSLLNNVDITTAFLNLAAFQMILVARSRSQVGKNTLEHTMQYVQKAMNISLILLQKLSCTSRFNGFIAIFVR